MIILAKQLIYGVCSWLPDNHNNANFLMTFEGEMGCLYWRTKEWQKGWRLKLFLEIDQFFPSLAADRSERYDTSVGAH